MNLNLRQCLQEVTEVTDVSKHLALVEALQPKHMHSILAVDSNALVDHYTCAVFAFDLVEDPTYVEIATYGLGNTYAGREFVEYALDNDLLTKLADMSQEPGVFAIYFDNGRFQHVGKVCRDNRITSKWGEGLLWEHEIWEVPASYGDVVHFYTLPSATVGLDLFCAYATTQGFHFDGGGHE